METSLDRVIAGVQSTLNNPPGFANKLNDCYMAIEEAIDRHNLFVGLHEEARLVTRQRIVLPVNSLTRKLPQNVGNVRELRILPETDQLRSIGYSPIDLVSLVKLHQFQATHCPTNQALNDPPVCAAQWTDATTGQASVEFSHKCSFDVPLEIVFEPASSTQLDPENPPPYLKSFFFLLKAEVARDLLPQFDFSDREYKRVFDLIQQRLTEGQSLLAQYLSQNDSAKGGYAESWGSRMRRHWR